MKIDFRSTVFGRLSRWVMLPMLLAAALGSAPLSTAHAIDATITVDTLDGGLLDNGGAGLCSLGEAIHNANIDGGGTPYLDCGLGAGIDEIVFGTIGTISLTQTLPTIDDPQNQMTIINGAGIITIDGGDTYEIVHVDGYATFQRLILQHANDAGSGAAVQIPAGGDLTVQQSLFFSNASSGGYGGAILNEGTLSVDRSTFTSNEAEYGGGAIWTSGTATISNSTFYNNRATGTGGGTGGGIASNGTTAIYSSTFSNNSSPASTGAAVSSTAGTATVRNSILANSTSGYDCHVNGGAAAGTYNLIEDDACGFTDGVGGMILGDDPRLGSLVNVPAYFTLQNHSPALDAGDNSFAVGSFDEPGNDRMSEIPWAPDTGSGTSPIIDLGAYEHQINCPGGSQFYVNEAAGGESTGTEWTDAFPDLQMALYSVASCGSPSEVWVAGGVYLPDGGGPGSPGYSFEIPPGTRLYGGFNGTEALLSERDPRRNVTILSGDIDGDDDSSNADGNFIDESAADIAGSNTYQVVYMNGISTAITGSTVLDGFTITGGNAVPAGAYGGGMLCNGQSGGTCSPTLSALTFSGNQAVYGGAMMNQAPFGGTSSPTLTDVTFTGNFTSAGGGGAVYNYGNSSGSSSPSFTNVTFYNNSAASAGAMWNDGGGSGNSSPTLTNVTFSNNSATGLGGAMRNDAAGGTSSPQLTNVILWGNTAASGSQIFNDSVAAAPLINYSVVQGGDSGSNTGTAFSSGTGNSSADPMLGTFQDNGGSTKTLSLLAGSSAIDSGNSGSCSATDQRHVSRPRGAACDMGAYERIPPVSDFDYDDMTDPAKFVPGTGMAWWLKSSTDLWDSAALGGDVASYVSRSDFNGDTRTDPGKYVAAGQALYYRLSPTYAAWDGDYMGTGTYTLMPGSDFDGDQMTDPAKYQSDGSVWWLPSSTAVWEGTFIGTDAAPTLPGSDYDGDGMTDVAKYVAAGAIWYLGSSDSTWHGQYIGADGTPVPASDYDGDGITDTAKYLTGSNVLWWLGSNSGVWTGVYLGPGASIPVPAADFDGDGKTDPARFDTGGKVLWWLRSSDGGLDGAYMGPETYDVVN